MTVLALERLESPCYTPLMDESGALALMFKALGDPTRLRIFNFLRSRRDDVAVDQQGDVYRVSGPTVGEVCCHITGLDRPSSTVSFHLKELRSAGLVTVEKRGKYLICHANPEAIGKLEQYLALGNGGCGDSC